MSLSLLVASLTVSHVIDWSEAIVDDADDTRSTSILGNTIGLGWPMLDIGWCLAEAGFVLSNVATSSGRCSIAGDVVPVGCRDKASVALCFIPGTCCMVNL